MSKIIDLTENLKKGEDTPFYSAVVVVNKARTHFLIGKRKEDDIYTSPAGGANLGETPKQTAIREAFEEANLRLTPGMLKELPITNLKNGKVCHCFVAILKDDQKIGVHHDPDKEVWRWRWYPIEKRLPEPMDDNRQKSFLEAKMKLMGLKKSDSLELPHLLEKGKKAAVGTLSPNGKYIKVSPGDWRRVNGHHFKVSVTIKYNGNRTSKKEFIVQGRNFDHAWEQVHEKIKRAEKLAGPVQIVSRNVSKIQPLKKSLGESELSGVNIDTTNHAVEVDAMKESPWLEYLDNCLKDFELAEVPREVPLEGNWVLIASQVDDGIYDGYVKNMDEYSGDYGQVVFQIKKMTLPAMTSALMAKNFISKPKEDDSPREEQDAHGIGELREILQTAKIQGDLNVYIQKSEQSEKKKLIELLNKGKKAMPVGTMRVWGGQKYVKHMDGWVAVTGKHHGKLMGQFKKEPTHAGHADEHKEHDFSKPDAPKAAAPEAAEPKEAAPKEEPKDTGSKVKELNTKLKESNKKSVRDRAEAETKRLESEGEYANARDSKVSNLGEDLKGSARHKAMRWKGIAAAEKDGTAGKLITRSMLLKNESPDFISKVNKDNYILALTLDTALKKFPVKPKEGGPEEGETNRKQYLEAYLSIKTKAEEILGKSGGLEDSLKELKEHTGTLIRTLREEQRFSAMGNQLVSFHNNALSASRYKTSSAFHATSKILGEYGKKNELTPQDLVAGHEGVMEGVKKVLEGVSPEKAFTLDKKESGVKRFKPSEMYLSSAEREGPKTGLTNMKKQAEYLTKTAGMRGIQWGNSVTDDEREHHLGHVANSFKDLTDILELPEEMGSFNGKLGLAIGARGKGTALAHYEPSTNVINLTRKGGVGSLAHEWGHFFDKTIAQTHGIAGSAFLSEHVAFQDSEVSKAMDELTKSEAWGEHRADSRKTLRAMQELGMSEKASYWLSTREMFARAFEIYVQHKLKGEGRKNTYLSGHGSLKEGDVGASFWPNKQVMDKMAPHFDKIFKTFKKSEHLKKALDIVDLQDALLNTIDTAPVRILLIQGGARSKNSCPGEDSKGKLVVEALQKAAPEGIEIDVLDLEVTDKDRIIRNCKNCVGTAAGYHCHWKCSCYGPGSAAEKLGDIMHDEKVYDRLERADGFIVLSPTNWGSVTSSIKAMFDRLVCANLALTKEQAKELFDGDIKNPEKTQPAHREGKYDHMLKNHLENRVAGFYMWGVGGGNDYTKRPLPKSMEGFEYTWNEPNSHVSDIVDQCRYSGIFVPEDLIKSMVKNTEEDYSTIDDRFRNDPYYVAVAKDMLWKMVSYIKRVRITGEL